LTIQAGRSIAVNANLTTTNADISLTANDAGAIAANRSAGAGNISFAKAANVTLSSGTGKILLATGTVGGTPGSINVGSLTALTTTSGAVQIDAGTDALLSGPITTGSGAISISARQG